MDYGNNNQRLVDSNQDNYEDDYNTNPDNEIQDIDDEHIGELEIDNPQEENEQDQQSIYENDDAYLLNDENQEKENDQEIQEDDRLNSKGFYQPASYSNRDSQTNQYSNTNNNKYKIKNTVDQNEYNPPQEVIHEGDPENLGSENQNEDKSNVGSLMKLQYISVCQACKENFNSSVNVPYLLKCGHFFCRNCIIYGLTDEEGRINCPDDGIVANKLSELKLLSNLIFDEQQENADEKLNDYCTKHPNQRLNHYIENTMEVVCVNCAFSRFKSDPRLDIKEIGDKCAEINEDLNKILEENQKNVETLRSTLELIKENKTTEESKVNNFYDSLIKFLDQKREDHIDQISNIFNSNADKLSERLDVFSQKMEESEEFKQIINQIAISPESGAQIADIINHFNQFIKDNDESIIQDLALSEYKFVNENESKVTKYLSGLSELKQKQKLIKFDGNSKAREVQNSKQATPQRGNQNQGNEFLRKDNQSVASSVKKNNEKIENDKKDNFPSSIVDPVIKYKPKETKQAASNPNTNSVGLISQVNKVGSSNLNQGIGANASNNSFMKPTPPNQNNYIIPNYTAPKVTLDKATRANKDKDQNLLSGYTIDKQKIKYGSNVVDTEDLLKDNREARNKIGIGSKYGVNTDMTNSYQLDADKRGQQLGLNHYSDYGNSSINQRLGNNELNSYPYNIYSTASNTSKPNSLLDENRYASKNYGGQSNYQAQPAMSLANQSYDTKYRPVKSANTYDIESGKYLIGKR